MAVKVALIDAAHSLADNWAEVDAVKEYRFPEATGSSLSGRQFSLPADFEGEANLVIVAFHRRQQEDVNTWIPFARTLCRRLPRLRYYEVPTIAAGNPVFRIWLDNAMKSGIPDPDARAATITLYLDKRAFRSSLGIEDENSVHVFVVEPTGRVLWRAEGPLDDEKKKSLYDMLGAPATVQQ